MPVSQFKSNLYYYEFFRVFAWRMFGEAIPLYLVKRVQGDCLDEERITVTYWNKEAKGNDKIDNTRGKVYD